MVGSRVPGRPDENDTPGQEKQADPDAFNRAEVGIQAEEKATASKKKKQNTYDRHQDGSETFPVSFRHLQPPLRELRAAQNKVPPPAMKRTPMAEKKGFPYVSAIPP